MVTLINTTKNYSVSKETENFKLSGNATIIQETATVQSFNGSFSTNQDVYCGSFNYNENDNGKASKNIYDIDKANFVELDTMLDAAIEELKEEINKQ